MVPHNLIQACFQQFKTDRTDFEVEDYDYNSSMMTNATEVGGHYVNGVNTLGLIVWSLVFGVILNNMGEKGEILVEVVTVINEAITTTINMIMGYLPVGLMFMTASNVVENYDWETIFKLGMFVLVVVIGYVYLLMAAVASTGAAGLPAKGAVTTLFVLAAAGLPAKEASTLVVVEWLL
ncbi:excitatory amino acid transporter 3-like [Perca fluviatilis]|uniref:excitatory amino acid transporter 3-like n=1 Tax=Perca fluviatilis TaxID=8168 RepID=UPI0019664E66|nr:excitatory amino acid transporter 3-like [Perca fluviatilis]